MSIPDLYLIGAPKSGTTSLARWLASHPRVHFSVPKEPFYWASDYPRLRAHYGFESRARYESLFSAADPSARKAEGSTVYLYSDCAVPDIVAVANDPRFVVALRNPLDLLISYHRTQLVALNESEPNFGVAWRRSLRGQLPPTDPLDPKLVDYARVGQLGRAVQRLLTAVPRDRVHIVMFEELAADPRGAWRALAEFAGITPEPTPSFDVHNTSTKASRSPVLTRLTHRPPRLWAAPMRHLRHWSRTTSNPLIAAAKRRMWRSAARPQVSDHVRIEIADYLRPDIVLLGELIDADLSHWVSVPSR